MENKKSNKSYFYTHSANKKDEPLINFDRLSWKEIDALNRYKTLFFLPISPLEEHGPHLPVGTDLLTAQDAMCEAIKCIKKNHSDITCVVLPALPIGYAGFNTDFPGTVSFPPQMIKKVVYNYGKMLATHGFLYLMICTYHMALGHLKGIYKAMNLLRRKHDMITCEPWGPIFYSNTIDEREAPVKADTKNEIHAGFRETSLMIYTHPSLVDKEYKNLPSVSNDEIMNVSSVFKSFKQLGIIDGYIGSPAKADVSYGKWFFELTVKAYVDAAEYMLQNKPLPDLSKKVKRRMSLLFWL